jgi:hypothetical protein
MTSYRTVPRAQRGDSKLGCILWLALVVAGALVAWEAVPVKVRSAELHDHMIDMAIFATRERSSEAIAKNVLAKAKELELPLTAKNLQVQRTESRIKLIADYTVVLEFPFGITYDWEFHHEVDRPIFYY